MADHGIKDKARDVLKGSRRCLGLKRSGQRCSKPCLTAMCSGCQNFWFRLPKDLAKDIQALSAEDCSTKCWNAAHDSILAVMKDNKKMKGAKILKRIRSKAASAKVEAAAAIVAGESFYLSHIFVLSVH